MCIRDRHMTEERGKLKFKNDEELINYYCSMEHPKTFSPAIMIVIFLTSIVGAIIGMELIVRFLDAPLNNNNLSITHHF